MAYEEELARRIRELLAHEPGLTEKKMFGGIAFLIGGNVAIAASGQGGILVRVDPAAGERLAADSDAHLAVMRGRELKGWLRVDSRHLKAPEALRAWVDLGASYARSLPVR